MTPSEEHEEAASLNGDLSAPSSAGLSASLSAAQTRQLLEALTAIRQGDFAVRMRDADVSPDDSPGAMAEVAAAVDAVSGQLHALALGISRLARATAVEGQLGAQIETGGGEGDAVEPTGLWRDMNTALNNMSHILAAQVRDLTMVAATVSEGDLSQKVTVAASGEMGELKATFNTMIDQLQLLKASVSQLMEQVQTLSSPHQ
jgi:methyl-accepting chemotaxis protein